jgi:hypothetical protein
MQLNFQYPDNLVSGCAKYLLSIPSVTNILGEFPSGVPYLFQQTMGVDLQQQGGKKWPGNPVTALVIQAAGTWAAPSPLASEMYPKLAIQIWADPTRDANGQVVKQNDAYLAADWLYKVVDSYMNRTSSDVVMLGDVTTWGSTRLGDIAYLPRINSDNGVIMGTVYYGLMTSTFFD